MSAAPNLSTAPNLSAAPNLGIVASHEPSDRTPVVVLIVTALVGAGVFAAFAGGQLAGSSLTQSLPVLVSYGLAFLVGLPLFAAFIAVAWKVG